MIHSAYLDRAYTISHSIPKKHFSDLAIYIFQILSFYMSVTDAMRNKRYYSFDFWARLLVGEELIEPKLFDPKLSRAMAFN